MRTKGTLKGILSVTAAIAMLCSTSVFASAADKSDVKASVQSAASYLASIDEGKTADYTNACAFAETVGGVSDEAFGNEAYKAAIENALAENDGKLMYTDSYTGTVTESLMYEAQAAKTLYTMGYDVTNLGGYSLIDAMANYDLSTVTNPYYLCEALTAATYIGAPSELCEKLLTALMSYYTDSEADSTTGGMNYWGLSTDNNGVFVEAIAPYASKNEEVKTAMEKSLKFIESMKCADGYDSSVEYAAGAGNCDSTAMALRAYAAAGDTEKAAEAYDLLLGFKNEADGGFYYMAGGTDSNTYASKDAANALAMYYLSLEDETETTEAETTEAETTEAETEIVEPTSDEATTASEAQTTTVTTTTTTAVTTTAYTTAAATTAGTTASASTLSGSNASTGAAGALSVSLFAVAAAVGAIALKRRK